jgi:hypothetical protein
MPDEEFDVLGEDELALLTRRFEKLHENRVNKRRNTRTCFQCGKPGHFIADCSEKVKNKDGYKHNSRMDGKYRSRRDDESKHKKKHKDERRSRKKESRGKARAMVGASDVDSSSAYSTSSSSRSEDEGDCRKSRKSSKNLSGPVQEPRAHSLALVGGSKGKANTNPSTRMFSLSSLMSMPDEEFDVLGEDELVLLTRRFEKLHENRVNKRRNTRTCFQCGKLGHFIADCSEKVENKDGYKHKSRMDGKYRSRRDDESKHKKKHKDERRSRKKESRGKARAMVGASDVDSSFAYSTSSSSRSEDEGDRRKSRKSSKNLSGLSCFAREGFCTMALSSGSKKSTQSDSDSDSDDEVRDELPFLRQRMKGLARCLITVMTCLERPRK